MTILRFHELDMGGKIHGVKLTYDNFDEIRALYQFSPCPD